MASRTLYQKQADTRTKKALKLRASYDTKVRKYALALLAALDGAEQARVRINRINALYGVDISPETLMVHAMRQATIAPSLRGPLDDYSPGEEIQLFAPALNGNGGLALEVEAVFGELAGGLATPVNVPLAVADLSGFITPQGLDLYVRANSSSGPIRVTENFMNTSIQLVSGEGGYLHLGQVAEGETIVITFTDQSQASVVREYVAPNINLG
ncbi:hypothetical protein [Hymenobacter glacieicola]|uniref:Uncharacterized protein n=1 Tax=Hymenobacter glacieicola TaxID=1562124 RepID=A0ABQ1WLW0_9BACT|nr:hypothetical protein [Hymenobacter glacieicola]GGG35778.1 hypothetical protein GCM10011378_10040 [Hymenobacter glacieicola]